MASFSSGSFSGAVGGFSTDAQSTGFSGEGYWPRRKRKAKADIQSAAAFIEPEKAEPSKEEAARKKTIAAFGDIEQTIYDLIQPDPIVVTAKPPIDVSNGLNAALQQLTAVSEGYEDLSFRVEEIKKAVADYEYKLMLQIEEDEFMLL